MTLISDWPVACWSTCHSCVPPPRSLLHRDSTEDLMDLSEEERNELMKKESSRLLKTGHRVSYSPRKEKALKIYLDGGPTKDPGQDWEGGGGGDYPSLFSIWPARCSVALPRQPPWHLGHTLNQRHQRCPADALFFELQNAYRVSEYYCAP